jgi:hypothetical protein
MSRKDLNTGAAHNTMLAAHYGVFCRSQRHEFIMNFIATDVTLID